ncbi:L-threonate dehydrogenase [Nisaea sp.]|uniref:L-threonate dehydrogenase n=1 Tax=Nisaea sp. TaxID=2024842 RepID=UPI003B529D8C
MAEKRIAGVIGLGSMGMGAARSLVAAGVETWGTDVRAESVADFTATGGKGAASPAELAAHVDALLVLVVNADQTESVLFGETGAVKHLKKGAVVVASSTVPAAYARDLEARLAAQGILMVDAPVSGGAAKAATGEMSVMASGKPEAFEAASFLLDAIATKVYRLGEEAGPGSTVKTINQLLAGVHIAAAAEAMALGIRAGVAPEDLFEVISNSAGASWMFNNRVPHILDGDYAPLSAVNIFVKDLGIVLETGKQLTFPLPLSAAAHQQFLGAAAAGLGKEDDSAVIKVFQKLAGIDLPEGKS